MSRGMFDYDEEAFEEIASVLESREELFKKIKNVIKYISNKDEEETLKQKMLVFLLVDIHALLVEYDRTCSGVISCKEGEYEKCLNEFFDKWIKEKVEYKKQLEGAMYSSTGEELYKRGD